LKDAVLVAVSRTKKESPEKYRITFTPVTPVEIEEVSIIRFAA
jgi:hypothetical protein